MSVHTSTETEEAAAILSALATLGGRGAQADRMRGALRAAAERLAADPECTTEEAVEAVAEFYRAQREPRARS